MDSKTRALHQTLIRLAKGAIKAWEAYIAPPSDQYPATEPPGPAAPTVPTVPTVLSARTGERSRLE